MTRPIAALGLLAIALLGLRVAGAQPPGTERQGPPPTPPLVAGQFPSIALGSALSYHVYLPPAYEEDDTQRYPVVYWLHGSNGTSKVASAIVSRLFAAAMRRGQVPPMILVFPDGLKQSMWVDSKDGRTPMEQVLVREFLPFIDAQYRTIASPQGRMVEGGSMGGYGAARLGFAYPQLFGAVSMLSAGPLQEVLDPQHAPIVGAANARAVLERVYGGDPAYFRALSPWVLAQQYAARPTPALRLRQIVGAEDPVLEFNRRFSAHLNELKVAHSYQELEGVDHQPRALFGALRELDAYWAFFREYFAPAAPSAPD